LVTNDFFSLLRLGAGQIIFFLNVFIASQLVFQVNRTVLDAVTSVAQKILGLIL